MRVELSRLVARTAVPCEEVAVPCEETFYQVVEACR